MDRAEQMREVIIHLIKTKAPYGGHHLIDPIRALPLPPQPPLADDVVAGVVARLRVIADLCRAFAATDDENTTAQAADLIERLAARVKWVEADLNTLTDANHRQALCINFTASALGPDISATIDGLPKAARHVLNRAEKAEAEVARLREALIWCSGSDDFQDGGKAREGWLKLCAPLIHTKGADHE